jgi:hypothetical protein
MATPSEPLLPVEPDPPSKLKFVLIAACAGLVLVGGAAFFVIPRGGSPADGPGAATSDPGPARPSKPSASKPSDPAAPGDPEERAARKLYDAAEAYERREPAEYEKRMAHWREVVTKYPTSGWAKKADDKYRAASASLQTLLDREFEGARKDAQSLAAAGHFADAVETLQNYKGSQSRDLLKRRADTEIAAVENASRLAYNEAAQSARALVANGALADAAAVFEAALLGAIPEVAERCRKSIAQLKEASAAKARWEESKKGDDARRAFREETAPKLLALVRGRRYDDALQSLSAAAAAPANAPIRDEIAAERASIADASSFWDAFLKALRARSGQQASLLLADGRRLTGKIANVAEDRVSVDTGDGSTDAPLDKLHADLLVGWTIGRTLAAEDGVTYVKAGLFFFCEGREDLARLYLATAHELHGPVDPAEKTFREGFLRAALAAKK